MHRICSLGGDAMAGKPVARLGDPGSHGGAIIKGASTILVNGKPVARVGDTYGCPEHGPNPIVTGANSVFGQGQLVAHVGSRTACGATITAGSPDTFVDVPTTGGVAEFFADFMEEKTFVEFQLFNEMEEPIPNQVFVVTLPDGVKVEGSLDENGFVHIDDVPRGSCNIVFPDLEYEEVVNGTSS